MAQRIYSQKDKAEKSINNNNAKHRPGNIPNSVMLSYMRLPEGGNAVSPELESAMDARKQNLFRGDFGLNPNSGRAVELPNETKSKLESHFGYDVDNLEFRESTDVNKIGAQAYTQGNVIHFRPGQFHPGSVQGQKMIGHEVAHVLQQFNGGVGGAGAVNLDTGFESGADIHGNAIAAMGSGISGSYSRESSLPAMPAMDAGAAPVQGWGISSWFGKHVKDKATKEHGYSDADAEGGHESLTRLASEKAGAALGNNTFASEQAQASLKKGTTFNDLGHHGTLGFVAKFTHFMGGHDEFIDQTHEGDMQFLHSMDTSGGDTNANSKKIQRYADFASDVYQNREVDVNGTNGALQSQNMLDYVLSQKPGEGKTGADEDYDPFQEMMLSTMVDSKKQRKFDEKFRKKLNLKEGDSLSAEQRTQRISEMRNEFFELSPEEKEKAKGKIGGEAAAVAKKRKKNASKYGKGSIGDFFTGGKKGHDAGMVALGSASHMLEDSFAGSHAKRAYNLNLGGLPDSAVGENQAGVIAGKTTPIMINANYTQQDAHKHAKADYLRTANTGETNAEKLNADITVTQGASLARDAAAQFMYMNAKEKEAVGAEAKGGRREQTRDFIKGITQTYNDPDQQELQFTKAGRAYEKGLSKSQKKTMSKSQLAHVDAYDQNMADTIGPNIQHDQYQRLNIYLTQLGQLENILMDENASSDVLNQYIPHIGEIIAETKNIQQQFANKGNSQDDIDMYSGVTARAQDVYQRALDKKNQK